MRRSLSICTESYYDHEDLAGLMYDRPPFLSLDEEQMCMAKLDKFMVDILIPLAASTQALLLVNAVSGECALSDALSRSYRMQKAKWGGKPPFVILSVTDSGTDRCNVSFVLIPSFLKVFDLDQTVFFGGRLAHALLESQP